MTDLNSRPFHPDPEKCCEACVFGTGLHAPWCLFLTDELIEEMGIPAGLIRTGREEWLSGNRYRLEENA
jgi:hypothetical protein